MGLLINGKWHTNWYDTKSNEGRFVREASRFRNWVTRDGQPGPTGEGGFKAEPNRYHLYVSLACPWAHRTLIFRKLKGLEDLVSLSVVNSFMGENGWTFKPGRGVIPDSVNGKEFLWEIYALGKPNCSSRVTVPVLWDKFRKTIVSNESADIIRMFNEAFDPIGAKEGDFYPVEKRDEVNEMNEWIYHGINNGVYRAGFATTQEAYREAFTEVFQALDRLEQRLSDRPYLTGDQPIEADWRLFTTLIRFDAVYFGHFKCNKKRIADYPALHRYLGDLYRHPGVAETVDIEYIKAHYYESHDTINPTRVVPAGPEKILPDPDREHFPSNPPKEGGSCK